MASKMSKQFKERIQLQKMEVNEKNRSNIYNVDINDGCNKMKVISLGDKIVKVQYKIGISPYEIIDQVQELFNFNGWDKFVAGQRFDISRCYDVLFDLVLKGITQRDNVTEFEMVAC